MIAYYRPKQEHQDVERPEPRPSALSRELFHGLTPEQFDVEAKSLAKAQSMTPSVRARLRSQLVERLKTPVDEPSWGPDWVKRGEKVAAHRHKRPGAMARMLPFGKKDEEEEDEEPLSERERTDSDIIARNMEKSRQVAHYRPLYLIAAGLALAILLLAMFVDYHIIREVWTRALANEFMVVPPALQSSVVFKSLQVVFAVLIVHFMLKISGVYGRNAMIVASFILALVMIGGLGYLVAYNNMAGATSAQQEQRSNDATGNGAIDQLFDNDTQAKAQPAAQVTPAPMNQAGMTDGVSLGLPKLSQTSLANADSWFWLAFASVIFFIVTTVAALYMQTVENNVRNFHIARDYSHRRRQFAQLHLLELADQQGQGQG
jgi:hypothetical protein